MGSYEGYSGVQNILAGIIVGADKRRAENRTIVTPASFPELSDDLSSALQRN